MKIYLLWFLLLLLPISLLAGPNQTPKVSVGHGESRYSVEEAIEYGYLEPIQLASYVDMRVGGDRVPVVSDGAVLDIGGDLWHASVAGSIVVSAYGSTLFGWYLTRIDPTLDSLSLYRYGYSSKANRLHGFGAITAGVRPTGYYALGCSDYDFFAVKDWEFLASATGGGMSGITIWDDWADSSCTVYGDSVFRETVDGCSFAHGDSVVVKDHWFMDFAIGAGDTVKLEIKRTIRMRGNMPYALIRYQVRSMDSETDSIAFVFSDDPILGFDGYPGVHNLGGGQVPFGIGRGFVETMQPDSFPAAPVLLMLKVGNAQSNRDTLPNTGTGTGLASVHLRDTTGLAMAYNAGADTLGQGPPKIPALFVAFNENTTPIETFLYIDGSENFTPLAFDSVLIGRHDDSTAWNYDTTAVIREAARSIAAKSEKVELSTTTWAVWEYAVGHAQFYDPVEADFPVIPRIRFTDGSELAVTYYRKR